jgi:predicted esterase
MVFFISGGIMKDKLVVGFFFLMFLSFNGQNISVATPNEPAVTNKKFSAVTPDTVIEVIKLLDSLSLNIDNAFFKLHCNSIIQVIEAPEILSTNEIKFIKELYQTFTDSSVAGNSGELATYLERRRPFIVSWISPTDSVVSLGWLLPPENWNPEQSYPLYVRLHGLYGPYQNPIEYMTRYFKPASVMETSFEDGYVFYPWGRGNLWYQGIAETDIWEGIAVLESLVKINPARKYLTGHSMGGYGAWYIAQKSADVWAGLGIYAGALWYGGANLLTNDVAQKLANVPVYIVCGDQDGLLGNNQTAYDLLQEVGNPDIYFTTFHGGHESLLVNWQNMYAWLKNYSNDDQTTVEVNDRATPSQFQLFNNYPNPFSISGTGFPLTTIQYSMAKASQVKLVIYNVLGEKIKTMVDSFQAAGEYSLKWNGMDETSNPVSSGMYFYRLETDKTVLQKKMVVIQ